jgi:chromatin remodeling complex protein RSC6
MSTPVNEKADIFESFNIIIDNLTLLKMQLTDLQQKIKTIEKTVKKELKKAGNCKVDKMKTTKAPSGFAKPTRVTKELCEFMDRPYGTEIARTEVTKCLISYIKSHKLQEEGKQTKIIPDEKLQNLLGITTDEIPTLTFFTIQKYMNKHFISSTINE